MHRRQLLRIVMRCERGLGGQLLGRLRHLASARSCARRTAWHNHKENKIARSALLLFLLVRYWAPSMGCLTTMLSKTIFALFASWEITIIHGPIPDMAGFQLSEKGSLMQRFIWLATITIPLLVSPLKGAEPAPIQTVTIKPNGAFSKLCRSSTRRSLAWRRPSWPSRYPAFASRVAVT